MFIDSLTRLDNTMTLPGKTFQYNYTLKNSASLNTNVIKSNLHQSILNSIKTNPALKEFRDNNVKLVYSYSDENGNSDDDLVQDLPSKLFDADQNFEMITNETPFQKKQKKLKEKIDNLEQEIVKPKPWQLQVSYYNDFR